MFSCMRTPEVGHASCPTTSTQNSLPYFNAAGWRRAENAKGSHEKWRHPLKPHAVIVPRSKSRHTANNILKQAGLPKAF